MYARPFEEEEDPLAESEPVSSEQPEYSFEGYNVEFSEKVMLSPIDTESKVQIPKSNK
jgi:hypothetical protein